MTEPRYQVVGYLHLHDRRMHKIVPVIGKTGQYTLCGIFRGQVLDPELCIEGRARALPTRCRGAGYHWRDWKTGKCIFFDIFRRKALDGDVMSGRVDKVVTFTVQHMETVSLMRRD